MCNFACIKYNFNSLIFHLFISIFNLNMIWNLEFITTNVYLESVIRVLLLSILLLTAGISIADVINIPDV